MKLLRLAILSIFLIILITISVVIGIRYSLAKISIEEDPLFPTEKPKYLKRPMGNKPVWMRLENVNFRFSEQISLKIKKLVAKLSPLSLNNIVNFDDIHSFKIEVQEGEAYLKDSVLEHIFRDHIFNYEGSPLKLKSLKILPPNKQKENLIQLKGDLKFGIWLGFEMLGRIDLDNTNNLIVITTKKIKTLGNPYTKPLLGIVGLNLQKLLPVPRGRGLKIKKNKIIIYPYKLFPPPVLSGKIEALKTSGDSLYLKFGSNRKVYFPKGPKSNALNYLFLYKGEVKFGKLYMEDTVLKMVDMDQSDEFDFYLEKYFQILVRGGKALIQADRSIIVEIPDYSDVIK